MKTEQIYNFLKNLETISLATIDNDAPRVRLMALISYNNKYWCCTKTSRPKYKQIKNNNKFEFCSIITTDNSFGSIRASGNIIIINDLNIKKELAKVITFFNGFWKSFDDPEFSLFELDLKQIEIHNPFDKKFYKYNMEGKPFLINK